MKKGLVLAFGELFLKSPNVQKIFKKKLIENLKNFLKREHFNFRLYFSRERIFVETEQLKKAERIVAKVFGIAWFAPGFFFEKEGFKKIFDFILKNYAFWIKEKETFALRLKRGEEIKEERTMIIDEIAKNIKRKVDLEKPNKEIFIEARKEGWYLYFKKKRGAGGLPVSSGGKVLTLISGGIDSPVASYLMAKRGAENIWLHFHSFPLVSNKSIEKVKKMANNFLQYQPELKVYFFPFGKIQMAIKAKVFPQKRILLYRRIMFKIGQEIAQKENCYALVTGESLGQVSSQTLPNLQIIEKAVFLPVLRPLISLDKEEIIKLAKKIGTYKISIQKQEDCCTLFVPKHATAQGNLKEIENIEKRLDLKKLITLAKKETEILKIKNF